jgi:hypothetical protein
MEILYKILDNFNNLTWEYFCSSQGQTITTKIDGIIISLNYTNRDPTPYTLLIREGKEGWLYPVNDKTTMKRVKEAIDNVRRQSRGDHKNKSSLMLDRLADMLENLGNE